MGRKHHCTNEERELILKLRQDGKSYKFIRETLSCSNEIIRNAIIWKPKAETRNRKSKTSQKMDRRIINLIKKDSFISSSKIKQDLNLDIDASNARRRLLRNNLYAHTPRKVPLLTKKNVQKRLKFARDHIDLPVEKWRIIYYGLMRVK